MNPSVLILEYKINKIVSSNCQRLVTVHLKKIRYLGTFIALYFRMFRCNCSSLPDSCAIATSGMPPIARGINMPIALKIASHSQYTRRWCGRDL